MPPKVKKAKLEAPITLAVYECKELLQDVEKSGVARSLFPFRITCNDKSHYYGEAGTARRRAFQLKWNNFKRLTTGGYVSILRDYKVQQGPHTLVEIEEARLLEEAQAARLKEKVKAKEAKAKAPPAKEEAEAKEEEEEDGPTPAKEEGSPVAEKEDSTAKFESPVGEEEDSPVDPVIVEEDSPVESPVIVEEDSPVAKVAAVVPHQLKMPSLNGDAHFILSPPQPHKILAFNAPAASTPQRLAGFQSPPATPQPIQGVAGNAAINSLSSTLSALSISDDWPGSKSSPFISPVNLEFPERSRDFDAIFVNDLPRREFSWKAIHLRVTCPVPDHRHWTAVVPELDSDQADLAGRVLLIKGPAQDFYQRNCDVYHQKTKCPKTLDAHDKAEINMAQILKDSPERFFKYYLVVFPEGTELHNPHLAGSFTNEVPAKTNIIPLDRNHAKNPFTKDINGASVYWEIAYKYGGQPLKRKDEGPKDEDLL
jgi:hypothetical protein